MGQLSTPYLKSRIAFAFSCAVLVKSIILSLTKLGLFDEVTFPGCLEVFANIIIQLAPKALIPVTAIVPTSANSPIALIAIPPPTASPPVRTKLPPIVPVEANNPAIVGAAK